MCTMQRIAINSHVEKSANNQGLLGTGDRHYRHGHPVANGNHQVDDAQAGERNE